MLRLCFAKFLELSGMALLASALYWGIFQKNMGMEIRLLALGALVFAGGWMIEPRSES